MTPLDVNESLIGRTVCNPARPEWGTGTVLRVQSTTVAGRPQHRVSVQFVVGHRVLLVPPAVVAEPQPEPGRSAGWIDSVAGNTLDERLTRLPESITQFLGTQAQRFAALAELYAITDDPAHLVQWARRQTRTADPLSHWSRDELLVAFERFRNERDADLRVTAARLVQAEGNDALQQALAALPAEVAAEVRAALRRPI